MVTPRPLFRNRGFTLIEAIMVIVITGIIASIVAVFIKTSIDSYVDSVRRAELTDAADVALRRLVREVRLAVPNSLRLTNSGGFWYLEFVPTKDGGRYRNAGDGSGGGSFLCTGNTINTTFDVLGLMPAVAPGDSVVVFNDASLNGAPGCAAPSNVYCGGSRALVNKVNANSLETTAALGNNDVICPYANNRFQIVDSAVQAVTYACPSGAAPGVVKRYWGYGFDAVQATPPALAAPAVVNAATVVAGATCVIDYTQNVQQRNGLLYIRLTLTSATGEQIVAFREVHVDNTP